MISTLPLGNPRVPATASQTLASVTFMNPPEAVMIRNIWNKSIGFSMICGIFRHGRRKHAKNIIKERRKAASDMFWFYGVTLAKLSLRLVPIGICITGKLDPATTVDEVVPDETILGLNMGCCRCCCGCCEASIVDWFRQNPSRSR